VLDLFGAAQLLAFSVVEHEREHLPDPESCQDECLHGAQVLRDRERIGICVNQRRLTGQRFDLDHRQASQFELAGERRPLLLSTEGDSLLVTNRSTHGIARALLVYSHPGGVGVTVLEALEPGEHRVTVLGPKEHPPETLLELARQQLTDFFGASVGPELAPAMAAAKSLPFLETPGLRLIALLDEDQGAAAVSFPASVSGQQRVVLSHSEILKPEEEARVLSALIDPGVGVEQALASFGRFTQAKLEFAEQSPDLGASSRAAALLTELRSR